MSEPLASPSLLRSPVTWMAALSVALIAGAAYLQIDRENARLHMEQELAAANAAETKRVADAEKRRAAEKQRFIDELHQMKETEDAQRQQFLAQRQEELKTKQFVAGELPPNRTQQAAQTYFGIQDEYRRVSQERNQRYQDARSVYEARMEVERQKQFLRQSEYEEQYARVRRDYNARYR